jgi:hypothetical protein
MDDRTLRPGRYPRDIGPGAVRHAMDAQVVRALFELPFPELIFSRSNIHRRHFDPQEVQISTLLSNKTGWLVPEDCCLLLPARALRHRSIKAEKLMAVDAGPRRGAGGEERRREPLLHGGGVARAEGS